MRPLLRPLVLALLAALLLPFPLPAQELPLSRIKLPPGFQIALYARVPGARSLTLSPSGTVFVGTREPGLVYALPDRDHDGVADEVITVARGLNEPNGVAFRRGDLYVAEVSRLTRYRDIEADLKHPPRPEVVNAGLPKDRLHGWRVIAFGPDDLLYVPIGAPCNICQLSSPYGTICRMKPDGTGFEVFARGVRNSLGFDWDGAGQLWFTDNGRDLLGDNRPPDELNHAWRAGLNFGFPCCYGDNVPDPAMKGSLCRCAGDVPPALPLPAHVAALGMRFYTGRQFPEDYRHQIFIAEHGSWNRSVPIGYRVTLVRLQGERPVCYEVFAEGWLGPDAGRWTCR